MCAPHKNAPMHMVWALIINADQVLWIKCSMSLQFDVLQWSLNVKRYGLDVVVDI